jgi:hypothetical protein
MTELQKVASASSLGYFRMLLAAIIVDPHFVRNVPPAGGGKLLVFQLSNIVQCCASGFVQSSIESI